VWKSLRSPKIENVPRALIPKDPLATRRTQQNENRTNLVHALQEAAHAQVLSDDRGGDVARNLRPVAVKCCEKQRTQHSFTRICTDSLTYKRTNTGLFPSSALPDVCSVRIERIQLCSLRSAAQPRRIYRSFINSTTHYTGRVGERETYRESEVDNEREGDYGEGTVVKFDSFNVTEAKTRWKHGLLRIAMKGR